MTTSVVQSPSRQGIQGKKARGDCSACSDCCLARQRLRTEPQVSHHGGTFQLLADWSESMGSLAHIELAAGGGRPPIRGNKSTSRRPALAGECATTNESLSQ